MRLPHFEMHRVETIEAATELLDFHGDEAVIHCGGTELVLAMKLGFAPYGHLIDIKPIEELNGIVAGDDLWIGAVATHRAIERHPTVRSRWLGLAEMAASVGNVRVRNVGTIGGNLCFGEPHSDPATALLAADASIECRRGREVRRIIPMSDFSVGPFETALRPGELLVGVRVPPLVEGATMLHRKIRFHERAAATVAMTCRIENNRFAHLRLAVGAVGNQSALVPDAEVLLADVPADALPALSIDELGALAVAAGRPVDDAYGSGDYKAHLLKVLIHRTLLDVVDAQRRP